MIFVQKTTFLIMGARVYFDEYRYLRHLPNLAMSRIRLFMDSPDSLTFAKHFCIDWTDSPTFAKQFCEDSPNLGTSIASTRQAHFYRVLRASGHCLIIICFGVWRILHCDYLGSFIQWAALNGIIDNVNNQIIK
jgi:hypothetical protein